MIKQFVNVSTFLFILVFSGLSHSASAWVDDTLSITMRAGAGNEYKIIRVLKSGQQLQLGNESEDGNWQEVTILGGETKGWVQKRYLSSSPTAELQLADMSQRLKSAENKSSKLSKENKSLKAELKQIKGQLNSEQKKVSSLSETKAHYEKVSSEPIRLAKRNSELNETLALNEAQISQLQTENNRLSSDNRGDVMLSGALILFFGLFLGWFITKRSSRSQSVWR